MLQFVTKSDIDIEKLSSNVDILYSKSKRTMLCNLLFVEHCLTEL